MIFGEVRRMARQQFAKLQRSKPPFAGSSPALSAASAANGGEGASQLLGLREG